MDVDRAEGRVVSARPRRWPPPVDHTSAAPDLHRLLDVLAAVGCHVYTGEIDRQGYYHEAFTGPGVEELLGGRLPPGRSASAVWNAAVHPEDWPAYLACDGGQATGQPVLIEYRLIGLDGVTRWVADRMWPRAAGPDGRQLVDGVVTDVTEAHHRSAALAAALAAAELANAELERARADAEQRAATDELTGLANRRCVTHRLHQLLARAAHDGGSVGLLLIDVDLFKRVNDRYGHGAGDRVLVDFARRLEAAVRPTDLVGRWGGEEFLALLPGAGAVLAERAEQIRSAVAASPFAAGGDRLDLRASIGGAVATGSRWDADALVGEADRALYAAKAAGRDRVVIAP